MNNINKVTVARKIGVNELQMSFKCFTGTILDDNISS